MCRSGVGLARSALPGSLPTLRGKPHCNQSLWGTPMQLVAVDILGLLPESPKGNSYLLVAGDYFTR